MKSRFAALVAVLAFAGGAVWSGYLAKSDDYCPRPFAASVETLFAPCQAFDAAIGHSVTPREAMQFDLPRSVGKPASTESPRPVAPTPAQLVAEEFQAIAKEHATTGVVVTPKQQAR